MASEMRWGFFGLFVSLATMSAPLLFPKIPDWLASLLFWGSVLGAVSCLVAIVASQLFKSPRRMADVVTQETAPPKRPSIVLKGKGDATISGNIYTGSSPFLESDRDGSVRITDNTISDR
jgi:hypothetical protein